MLGKDWTLKDAIGFLRIITKETNSGEIVNNFLVDIIHNSISEIAQQLSVLNQFDYGVEASLAITFANNYGTASISSFTSAPVGQIIKIVDKTQDVDKRQFSYKSQERFSNLRNVKQLTTGLIFWTRNGETIQLYSGDLTPAASVKIFYTRLPIKATLLTDYLDIKDCWIGLALAKSKLAIYEAINKKPPENIAQTIQNAMQQMKNSGLQKFQNDQVTKK